MRTISKIIIHTSDSPDDRDIGFSDIDQWHKLRFKGYMDFKAGRRIYCGYHFIIRRNGVVEPGRDIAVVGAHCSGQNAESIGIVWAGRDKISDDQKESLCALISLLLKKYELELKDVYGHKDFNDGKTCPNLDMDQVRGWVKEHQKGQ